MKSFFIYRDGELFGNKTGYTTLIGAKKSLVGNEDWYKEMLKYYHWQGKKDTPPQEYIDMKMYEWSEYNDCWMFRRDIWSRKIWQEYVKNHYQFIEKEYNINIV